MRPAVIFASCLILVWAIFAPAPEMRAADPPATYIRAGKLLDVRAGKILTGQIIVIRGDKIERVAASGDVKIPPDAIQVDLTRATVLPGLIDAHEHIFLTGEDNGR